MPDTWIPTVWTPTEPTPAATLRAMVACVVTDYQSVPIVERATAIATAVPPKDEWAIAAAILAYLRRTMPFVGDPMFSQWIRSPRYSLRLIDTAGRAPGNCVDVAVMAAALGMAVGIPACFVTEGYGGTPTPGRPTLDKAAERLEHVYTILGVKDGGGRYWLNLDTQRQWTTADSAPALRFITTIP